MKLPRLRRPSPATLVALGLFVLAFVQRIAWVAFVQSPFDTIYSDMAGYVSRARYVSFSGPGALQVMLDVDPWGPKATLYPPGAHLIYAAQMKLLGWDNQLLYAAFNCVWGAMVAPCVMLLALRVVPRLRVAAALGLLASCWYPVLAFSGFFSSEQPFAGLLALSAWLLVRQLETGKGAVPLGLASGLAYLVRPQILLTLVALAALGLGLLVARRGRGPRLPIARLLLAGAVFSAFVGWGAWHFHAMSGRWGLISDNATMTRLWADTDYGRVRAIWRTPGGEDASFVFQSPPKAEIGELRELDFDGYVGDPVLLDAARRAEVAHMTAGQRAVRWLSNVRLLFVDNALWPVSERMGDDWQRAWYVASKALLLAVFCPFALIGLGSCARRPTTALVVCAAHLLTALVTAAFFFAENRYRVPYDFAILVLALEGARVCAPALSRAAEHLGFDMAAPGGLSASPSVKVPVLRRPSPTTLIALGLFVVALGIRLEWVAMVESPFDNIYSDMGGYVERALGAAEGHPNRWLMFDTLYPPGAHMVYAAQMLLVGWSHHAAYLVLNCAWGAVVAPCTMLLALRVVPRLPVAIFAGVVMALWYPLLAFSGFFSSEQPFAGLLALSAWLLVRHVQTGKNAISLGVASSLAYLVRPQIILTLAALTVVGLVLLVRRPARAPRLHVLRLLLAGAVLTATVGWGAWRYHALCGRWGLISDNAAMTRLWADTNYGKVRAKWVGPDGDTGEFFFASPPKGEIGEQRELVFDGYVGDPVLLDRARRNETNYMSAGERIVRWVNNVRLLFVDNGLWPPSQHMGRGWKLRWYELTQSALLVLLCPLAVLGLVSCARRPTTVLVVCGAHVVTMLVVAAFFFAENRYRMPYDFAIVILALEGARRGSPALTRWLT